MNCIKCNKRIYTAIEVRRNTCTYCDPLEWELETDESLKQTILVHQSLRGQRSAAGGEDGLSYYERKVKAGLIDRADVLSLSDLECVIRDELVDKYKKIAYALAHKMHRQLKASAIEIELEDLIQEALLALTKYSSNVDPQKAKPQTYLYKCIKNELKQYVKQNCKSGITGVSQRSFWGFMSGKLKLKNQKQIDDYNFLSHYVDSLDRIIASDAEAPMTYHDVVADSSQNPEELVIGAQERGEAGKIGKIITKFFRSLGTRDRIVFNEYILGDRSTREVANMIKVKSPQTVINIANRLKEQLKEKINV